MDLFTHAEQARPQPKATRHADIPYREQQRGESGNEDLWKLDIGRYETAKKSNHSALPIPIDMIDRLEAGTVNSEDIDDLAGSYPIYRYKTCLTIHGRWPDIARTSIGSYKNVIQNENGSVEVRWTAIDLDKKHRIAKALKAAGSEIEYKENSTATYFSQWKVIRTKEQWEETVEAMRETAHRVNSIDQANIRVRIVRYTGWMGLALELIVEALAIPENAVVPLTLALVDMESEADLQLAIDRHEAQEQAKKEEREREQQERQRQAAEEAKPKIAQMEKDIAVIQAHIAQWPEATTALPEVGKTYAKATWNRTELRAYMRSLKVEKGSFGRLKVTAMKHYVQDGQIDPVGEPDARRYGRTKKEYKADELTAKFKWPENWKQA